MRSVVAAVLACALAGCASAASSGPSSGASPGDATLTVFAAASLTGVLDEVADGFEAAHPGVTVATTYAGSSDLAAQILEGAPADVLASADEETMAEVASLVDGAPTVFATNTLTLVVPEGNPARVTDLGDLADPDVVSVVCAPQVPCGAATAALAELEDVTLSPSSEEASVTGVLGKVASGQADAGVVYVTDVARAAGVEAVPIAGADAVVNRYPAAALTDAADPALAAALVAYLAGAEAQAVLADAGFGAT
ncbi:molybdate ABC transporter substrate-binding protein [Demequina mangrovi]|uniref:Molybdate transport system substrate-binding protein n=1 Tax=Demequina mangrovi TaxID=1043493 RepID=A0A1H6V106_9MICO|nr:molybdate ABC transporter substrate-binding protein [Demequina mangrovi]SEI96644.1 molybdate transport system substrate-binding protein [Demequina mangrovi]